MKYLFYLAHPSHYYTFKVLMKRLRDGGDELFVLIKTKDILEDLVRGDGLHYLNISKIRRKNNFFSIARDVWSRLFKVGLFIVNNKIDRVVSCGSDIGIAAKVTGRPHFLFNDDDHYIVPNSARFGWPFVTRIFAPSSCDMGRFLNKTEYYKGYQKLFYLQDSVFTPDRSVIEHGIGDNRYFLIRTVGLEAHHDKGIRGLDDSLVRSIIDVLEPFGSVYITSEKKLPPDFQKYQLRANPISIHQYIYFSDLLIADSQSMIHEAAILGTPSIRYNDFVGEIGVLEDLEHNYGLTIGIKPDQKDRLLNEVHKFLEDSSQKKMYRERAHKMMTDMIDVNDFVYWYLLCYPDSRIKSSHWWDLSNVHYLPASR